MVTAGMKMHSSILQESWLLQDIYGLWWKFMATAGKQWPLQEFVSTVVKNTKGTKFIP